MIDWKGSEWALVAVDRSRALLVQGVFDGSTIVGLVHEYAPKKELDATQLHRAQVGLRIGGASVKKTLERLHRG